MKDFCDEWKVINSELSEIDNYELKIISSIKNDALRIDLVGMLDKATLNEMSKSILKNINDVIKYTLKQKRSFLTVDDIM